MAMAKRVKVTAEICAYAHVRISAEIPLENLDRWLRSLETAENLQELGGKRATLCRHPTHAKGIPLAELVKLEPVDE